MWIRLTKFIKWNITRLCTCSCNLTYLLYKQNLGRLRGFQLQLSPGNLHPLKCFNNTQSSETHLGLAFLNWENLFPLKSCHKIVFTYIYYIWYTDYCNNEETTQAEFSMLPATKIILWGWKWQFLSRLSTWLQWHSHGDIAQYLVILQNWHLEYLY